MFMRYHLLQTFEQEKVCLDQDLDTGSYLLSIPVFDGNRQYLESYLLTQEDYEQVSKNADARQTLTAKCRARQNDAQLVEAPPAVRGIPCATDEWRGGALINIHSEKQSQLRALQIFAKEQFCLKVDQASQTYLLSIRVLIDGPLNDFTDSEYYEVTAEEYEVVSKDTQALIAMAALCQLRCIPSRLIGKLCKGAACHYPLAECGPKPEQQFPPRPSYERQKGSRLWRRIQTWLRRPADLKYQQFFASSVVKVMPMRDYLIQGPLDENDTALVMPARQWQQILAHAHSCRDKLEKALEVEPGSFHGHCLAVVNFQWTNHAAFLEFRSSAPETTGLTFEVVQTVLRLRDQYQGFTWRVDKVCLKDEA